MGRENSFFGLRPKIVHYAARTQNVSYSANAGFGAERSEHNVRAFCVLVGA